PHRSTTSPTHRSVSPASATSPTTACRTGLMLVGTWAAASSRSQMLTRAPSARNRSTIEAPIPEAPALTSTRNGWSMHTPGRTVGRVNLPMDAGRCQQATYQRSYPALKVRLHQRHAPVRDALLVLTAEETHVPHPVPDGHHVLGET